jgi:hypothetical protein
MIRLFAISLSLLLVSPAALAATAAVKTKINPPPAADLHFAVKARQGGLAINGDTVMQWRSSGKSYSVTTATRAMLVGKILDERSEGAIDEFGLAPAAFTEKRFRRDGTTTTFDRRGGVIKFSDGSKTYPIKGGEQDRASVMWQLISMARAAPAKFKPGASWTFFVAAQRDADPWTFKVDKPEKLKTALGDLQVVHVIKAAPDKSGQQLDIWLAPSRNWYPVRLRLAEPDGEYVEQELEKIEKK